MKGIIYLVETAISTILIVIVLSFFLTAQGVDSNFERSDLISIGNNILLNLKYSNKLDSLLKNELGEINKIKPPNVDVAVGFSGTPKAEISVGCYQETDECTRIQNILTTAYVNGRFVNYKVEDSKIFFPNNLNRFDALVFIDQADLFIPGFTDVLDNYVRNGGTVVSINEAGGGPEFFDFFNLTQLNFCVGADYLKFASHEPDIELIPKHFLGMGFDVRTPNGEGTWYIWEEPRGVVSTPPTVTIEGVGTLPEGGTFSLTGPDSASHVFRVKKILSDRVDIQASDATFPFKQFSQCWVYGNNIVSDPLNVAAAMTANNSAIWIDDFPTSDEYRTLVKSAISSRVMEWNLNTPATNKETVSVSTFANTCCDMLETIEVILTLWYRF